MHNATRSLATAMPNDSPALAGPRANASAPRALAENDGATRRAEGDRWWWTWIALSAAAGTSVAGMGYWLGKRRKPQT